MWRSECLVNAIYRSLDETLPASTAVFAYTFLWDGPLNNPDFSVNDWHTLKQTLLRRVSYHLVQKQLRLSEVPSFAVDRMQFLKNSKAVANRFLSHTRRLFNTQSPDPSPIIADTSFDTVMTTLQRLRDVLVRTSNQGSSDVTVYRASTKLLTGKHDMKLFTSTSTDPFYSLYYAIENGFDQFYLYQIDMKSSVMRFVPGKDAYQDEDEVVMVKNDALNIRVSSFQGSLQDLLRSYERLSEFEEAYIEAKDRIDVTVMRVVAFYTFENHKRRPFQR